MNPVGKLCQYESLKDGSLDLADIALMNDTLLVRADNEALQMEKVKRGSS